MGQGIRVVLATALLMAIGCAAPAGNARGRPMLLAYYYTWCQATIIPPPQRQLFFPFLNFLSLTQKYSSSRLSFFLFGSFSFFVNSCEFL